MTRKARTPWRDGITDSENALKWAEVTVRFKPEGRAIFERQAASPRSPHVTLKAHRFAKRVMKEIYALEAKP